MSFFQNTCKPDGSCLSGDLPNLISATMCKFWTQAAEAEPMSLSGLKNAPTAASQA